MQCATLRKSDEPFADQDIDLAI